MGTWVNRVFRWLSWPSTSNNILAPWYQIIWRAIFTPTIYFGIIITYLSVLFAYGPEDANTFWRKANII